MKAIGNLGEIWKWAVDFSRARERKEMSKSNTVWSGSVAAVWHPGLFSDQLLMRLMVILSTRVAGGGGL